MYRALFAVVEDDLPRFMRRIIRSSWTAENLKFQDSSPAPKLGSFSSN
jgi:hypothetical protein